MLHGSREGFGGELESVGSDDGGDLLHESVPDVGRDVCRYAGF